MSDPATDRQNLRAEKQKAAKARWARHAEAKADWQSMPLDEAKQHLAEMRADIELGAHIIQQRIGQETPVPHCVICNTEIKGLPAQTVPIRDHATGLYTNEFYCSAECVVRKNQRQSGVLSLAR